jgi:all-trans-retinol 13,14-reductase
MSNSDLTGLCTGSPLEERPLFLTCDSYPGKSARGYALSAICPCAIHETDRWTHTRSGKRPETYGLFKEKIAETIRGQIEKFCPEIQGDVLPVECATPLTIRDYSASPFGSLYGVKHKIGQYNPTQKTKAKGLFLAGQATVAPGLLGAVISAMLACGLVLGHDRVIQQIREHR